MSSRLPFVHSTDLHGRCTACSFPGSGDVLHILERPWQFGVKLEALTSPSLHQASPSRALPTLSSASPGGHHEQDGQRGDALLHLAVVFKSTFKTSASAAAECFIAFIKFLSTWPMNDRATGSQSFHAPFVDASTVKLSLHRGVGQASRLTLRLCCRVSGQSLQLRGQGLHVLASHRIWRCAR